jgi:hypothetical protein
MFSKMMAIRMQAMAGMASRDDRRNLGNPVEKSPWCSQ